MFEVPLWSNFFRISLWCRYREALYFALYSTSDVNVQKTTIFFKISRWNPCSELHSPIRIEDLYYKIFSMFSRQKYFELTLLCDLEIYENASWRKKKLFLLPWTKCGLKRSFGNSVLFTIRFLCCHKWSKKKFWIAPIVYYI